jgi:hypothetical protein
LRNRIQVYFCKEKFPCFYVVLKSRQKKKKKQLETFSLKVKLFKSADSFVRCRAGGFCGRSGCCHCWAGVVDLDWLKITDGFVEKNAGVRVKARWVKVVAETWHIVRISV